MGCFSYSCSISGLPIAYKDPVVYLALVPTDGRQGIGSRGIGINCGWMPATLPIRGCYNDYGSVEKLKPSPKAFFDSLQRRAIERPVGENPVHDLPITSGMTQDEWLRALWEERVQIKHRTLGVATLVQTMVRREVWEFLVRRVAAKAKRLSPHDVQSGLGFSTHLDRVDLQSVRGAKGRRELVCVSHGLAELGRPWARGTCCGPQFPSWRLQQDFLKVLTHTVNASIEEIEEESGEPYEDHP